jgi:glycine/sarcosine N-methyltransferase
MSTDDRYESFDYSRLISWEPRLRREWPFLEPFLRDAPSNRVLDLGSGTGEHARFVAARGFDVTGVDASPAMVDRAIASLKEEQVRFLLGDMRKVSGVAGSGYGAAYCLGNAVPHLTEDDDLRRLAHSLREALVPRGTFILQLLNYDRIEVKNERALPLSLLPDHENPEATIVFLRLMELHADRRVTFMPTVLRMRTDAETPIELVASRRVEIRGWRREEIEALFRDAGFESIDAYGSYEKAPFDAPESRDLILVMR